MFFKRINNNIRLLIHKVQNYRLMGLFGKSVDRYGGVAVHRADSEPVMDAIDGSGRRNCPLGTGDCRGPFEASTASGGWAYYE